MCYIIVVKIDSVKPTIDKKRLIYPWPARKDELPMLLYVDDD